MKKRIFLFIFFSLLLIINAIGLYLNYFSNEDVVLASENLAGNRNNALTMMLETDVDSNEYEVATSNEWPTEGYIFNAEMSACERGGTLSWDSENNRVVMASGSADKCYVYFDRYTTVRITNVTTSNITNNSITLTVEATVVENSIATYYFSNNDGVSYEKSANNTYTFSGLETGTEYNFKVYAVDSNGVSSNVYSLSESTTSAVYLADYIKNTVYTGDGNNGLFYHDGNGTYTNAAQEAKDNSYRYSGANPNNYVCFGSDEATCPVDNLYRIIGVFDDQVKLIKSTSYGSYSWGSNNWQTSTLKNTLNSTYLNSLGEWSNLIEANTIWYLGGWSTTQATPKQFYGYERGTTVISGRPTSDIGAIGLMYPSDYGYAVNPVYWSYLFFNPSQTYYDYRVSINSNWLNSGSAEWTITPSSSNSNYVVFVANAGNLNTTNARNGNAVRPVFYLKSYVALVDGVGTSSDPYIIALG